MRFNLPVPRMVAEANTRPRFKRDNLPAPVDLIIEILIFTLIYVVAGLVFQNIILLIGMIPLMLLSPAFQGSLDAALAQGQGTLDFATSMSIVNEIMANPSFSVLMLFATLGSILGVILYCRVLEGRKLKTLGFRRGRILREYLVGVVVGLVLFSAAVLICVITGTMSYAGLAYGSAGLLVLFFLGFMVQGLSEEVLCRGYFLVSLARRQHLAVAVIASSCAFGALHLFNANVTFLAILNIILFGCVMGVYLLKRGNIWGVAAIHTTWNFVQGNIFGIEVSGMDKMPSLFAFNATESGALINGGAFGIEGGLAATLALTAALIITLLLKSADSAPLVLATPDANLQVAVMPSKYPIPGQSSAVLSGQQLGQPSGQPFDPPSGQPSAPPTASSVLDQPPNPQDRIDR